MRSATRTSILAAAALAFLLAAGCDDNKKITASEIRHNPTPELQSVAMTHEQRENAHARTIDITERQIWDDLDMILLLDKPVRLTRYPVP